MRGRGLVVAFLIAFWLMLAPARSADACSCVVPSRTFEEASASADLAFEGRMVRRWPALILSSAFERTTPLLTESYDFVVTKPIRGDFGSPPRLYFGATNCSASFSEGVEYRVIAYRDLDVSNRFTASWCSPNEAITRLPGPGMEPPAETPTHPLRRTARFATSVAFGSMSTPLEILRNISWNPWVEETWPNRGMTLAAVLYPLIWLSFLITAFRAVRRGWTRWRSVLVLLCGVTIPWLALLLARDGWTFEMITR